VGLVPTSNGGWPMIGASINDGTDNQFCTEKYTFFDKVTYMIYDLGCSALIAKRERIKK
jgi:hypothetical protein